MALTPVKRTDQFEFPKSIVPIGLTYQWCARTFMGDVHPQFQKLRDDGWMPVPLAWHREWFDCAGPEIEIGGQMLLCHAHPKDEEAERIAGAQRNVQNWTQKYGGFSGGVRVVSQTPQGIPRRQMRLGDYTLSQQMLPEVPPKPELGAGATPQSMALPKSCFLSHRRSRWPILTWLFDLISVEQNQ